MDIKKIRTNLNLSQEAFSRMLGCSHQTIIRWEAGSNNISPAYQREIARLLAEIKEAKEV